MSYVKVNDHPGLVRDTSTGAIINTDQNKARQAVAFRNAQRARNHQIVDINARVENLENVVNDINTKLDTLISVLSKNS